MNSKWKLIGTLVLIVACLALFAFVTADHFLTVYPTPDTESAFLKDYALQPVVERFQVKNSGSQWVDSATDAAGRRFARHERAFHGRFSVDPKDQARFMSSLQEDILAQLSRHGAQILNKSTSTQDGFRLDYREGKSLGSAVISPLRTIDAQQGLCQVALDISMSEKWFRTEPGLIAAGSNQTQ
jgi:hypothetical protein